MKHIARYALGVALALGLVYAGWLAIRYAITRMSCGSEETVKVEELAGLRFEVTYLSCDTIAKMRPSGCTQRQRHRMEVGFFRNGEINGHFCSVTTPEDLMLHFLLLPVRLKIQSSSPFLRSHRLTTRTASGQI